jgi:hypothetical protein
MTEISTVKGQEDSFEGKQLALDFLWRAALEPSSAAGLRGGIIASRAALGFAGALKGETSQVQFNFLGKLIE